MLAAEDVLLVPQRPKVDPYEDHNFVVLRMLMLKGDRLVDEQVGIFCFNDTLITFQERSGDLWQPIRERIEKAGSRLRLNDTGYLIYTLIDAVGDHLFP